MIKYPVIITLLIMVFLYFYDPNFAVEKKKIRGAKALPVIDYSRLKDTLYTYQTHFIEVNLAEQKGYLHSRDSVMIFPLSSGNKKLEEGVETNEGLFVIQCMLPEWHSSQFDSTLMINWMGFNHGIGFHALNGNGYYKHLGKRKSSHGCVRISREDSQLIYSRVRVGTPVLVHSGNNAVFIGFSDSTENYERYSYKDLNQLLPSRLQKLYEGRYYSEAGGKLFISRKNVMHSGLPIGNAERIPSKQLILPGSLDINYTLSDNVKVTSSARIVKESEFLSYNLK
jgi:hypothetical protein